jgi:hypothetical protein
MSTEETEEPILDAAQIDELNAKIIEARFKSYIETLTARPPVIGIWSQSDDTSFIHKIIEHAKSKNKPLFKIVDVDPVCSKCKSKEPCDHVDLVDMPPWNEID